MFQGHGALPLTTPACRRQTYLHLGTQAIGRQAPLLITHRLDTCTEGVLVMGKTKEFVQRFNALLLVPGALQKTYRALARTPLQLGETLKVTTDPCRFAGIVRQHAEASSQIQPRHSRTAQAEQACRSHDDCVTSAADSHGSVCRHAR